MKDLINNRTFRGIIVLVFCIIGFVCVFANSNFNPAHRAKVKEQNTETVQYTDLKYGEDCEGVWKEPDGDQVIAITLNNDNTVHIYWEDGTNIIEGDYRCTIANNTTLPVQWKISELDIIFSNDADTLTLKTSNSTYYLQPNT